MAPDPQLLTKQVNVEALTIAGNTTSVRFNLQRGKIARIWGFVWVLTGFTGDSRGYSVFVRKSSGAVRQTTPKDLLWSSIKTNIVDGINFAFVQTESSIMFPKPHRTSGVTVQMHCTSNTSTSAAIIIYYDIDDVMKGELVQAWEKNITKGRTRRTIAP